MGAGIVLKHKRKTTSFVASELAAGEMGLNTSLGTWWFSVDGSTVTSLDSPNNASVADQTINANSSALLTGSVIAIPVGKLRVGTILRWRIALTKTASGTAANTFIVRLGTAGTISDAAILTFNLPIGTAVVDAGQVEILVTIRGPLGASCIAQGQLTLIHNLSATGLSTVPCVVLNTTSSGFTSTTANLFASVSCTTAVSTVLTFQLVQAEAINV